ncbi:DNA adenine methylase, partial [Clostridium sp. MT-14]|uniref:DNA adenine methylase n=1 Tax=Clostridium sp. MT-14 TaxID=3348360 RepID=UPI0035F2CBBD
FFMLIKTSYGSDHRSYGCVKKNVNVMIQYLTDIQERLSGVVIENKDFKDLIIVYDKEDALIYLDPPYYGTERYYQVEFSGKDHIRLCDCLKNVKGKFILSYNDCEFVRSLYNDFNIDEVQRNHNLMGKYRDKEHRYSELIIRNY